MKVNIHKLLLSLVCMGLASASSAKHDAGNAVVSLQAIFDSVVAKPECSGAFGTAATEALFSDQCRRRNLCEADLDGVKAFVECAEDIMQQFTAQLGHSEAELLESGAMDVRVLDTIRVTRSELPSAEKVSDSAVRMKHLRLAKRFQALQKLARALTSPESQLKSLRTAPRYRAALNYLQSRYAWEAAYEELRAIERFMGGHFPSDALRAQFKARLLELYSNLCDTIVPEFFEKLSALVETSSRTAFTSKLVKSLFPYLLKGEFTTTVLLNPDFSLNIPVIPQELQAWGLDGDEGAIGTLELVRQKGIDFCWEKTFDLLTTYPGLLSSCFDAEALPDLGAEAQSLGNISSETLHGRIAVATGGMSYWRKLNADAEAFFKPQNGIKTTGLYLGVLMSGPSAEEYLQNDDFATSLLGYYNECRAYAEKVQLIARGLEKLGNDEEERKVVDSVVPKIISTMVWLKNLESRANAWVASMDPEQAAEYQVAPMNLTLPSLWAATPQPDSPLSKDKSGGRRPSSQPLASKKKRQ